MTSQADLSPTLDTAFARLFGAMSEDTREALAEIAALLAGKA